MTPIFLYIKSFIIAQHNLKPEKFLSFAKSRPQEVSKVDTAPCLKLFTIDTLRVTDAPPNIVIEYFPRFHTFGLLPNDTFHILTMEYLNLVNIAAADKDFRNIPYLYIWAP